MKFFQTFLAVPSGNHNLSRKEAMFDRVADN